MWETEPAAAEVSTGVGETMGAGDAAVVAELAGCDMAAYVARRLLAAEPRQLLNLTIGHFGFNE
jgi:hypothetical protein